MSQIIRIKDKEFKPYISTSNISLAVAAVAEQINQELKNEDVVFLAVLNGSFMFASDLMKQIQLPCTISFIKLASYHGTSSSGTVNELVGLTEDLTDKTVVIIEDIVDTGNTLEKLTLILNQKKVKQIKVATLLFKPDAYKKNYPVHYAGMKIKNEFVVGYGLDYDGFGRNLKEIYVIV